MADHPVTGRRILVTGGQGFIGRHVVRVLAEAGARPVAVAQRGRRTLEDLPGETLVVELENRDEVKEAVAGAEAVIHLAARAGGIQFQQDGAGSVFATNRRITDNVLAACIHSGVSRLFVASSLVIYRPRREPLQESDPVLGPADKPSPYAWSKITDEVVVSWQTGIEVVVGRFGNVYGPGASFDPNRSTMVHAIIDRAARAESQGEFTVWGDGKAVRSFVFVEDAARAVVAALSRGVPGEAYNIDSGEAVTNARVAELVRDAVDPSLRIRFDATKPSGLPYRVGSVEKIAALGFKPEVELGDGIRTTLEWYRGNVSV